MTISTPANAVNTTAHAVSATAKALRGGLLAAALLVAGAAPAQAAAHDFPPNNWLYLTVAKGDARNANVNASTNADANTSANKHDTLLMCDPPEGHTRAAEACGELAAADGDIARIPAKDSFCPMVYAPVTVHARGEWSGRKVDYTETFSSTCFMTARTGSVFALDS